MVADTVATAIKIGAPASYDRAVLAIRETDGTVLAVTDQEILEAKAVIDAAGVGCEPASAASVAGVKRLREGGMISPDARVVAVLTGHLLKDPGIVERMHSGPGMIARPNHPIPVAASVAAIRAALN